MNNIYLITSTSFNLMEEEIKKIVNNNIYTTFDLNTTDIKDILEEANYFSLFDEKKYIIVKSANIFSADKGLRKKKKDVLDKVKKGEVLTEEEQNIYDDYNNKYKPVEDYLNNSNPNTILIFSLYDKIDKSKEITKTIISKYQYIDIPDLKPNEIKSKITKLFKDNGFSIDDKSITSLLKTCKNNYDLIINESNKITLYYNEPTKVKYEDVLQIISVPLEDNNFKFVDTIMQRNIKESFKMYDDLMIQKVEPIMILSMLAKEIRYTLLIKNLLKSKNKYDIMKMLDIKYDFQYDKYVNYGYQYKEKQLEEYLKYLCDNDYRIKTGKISNKLALQLFIIKICE